jgi:AmmeMemoRadiSam system protein A
VTRRTMPLSDDERRLLLETARHAIRCELQRQTATEPTTGGTGPLGKARGCFVTLTIQGDLRGCIGTIEPVSPLISAVADNARNAAFRDPRFSPLSADELERVKIEVSVLSAPEPVAYRRPGELKTRLQPGVHGVILNRGWRGATFLPQVWEQLPEPEAFLSHLCLKAGLSASAWKEGDVDIRVYTAEHFSE